MNTNKEEEILIKRMKELSLKSYNQDICTFTDFLNLNELNLYYTIERSLVTKNNILWGGHEHAERKMIAFYHDNDHADNINYQMFPIDCIKIEPQHVKYSEEFTHRDFLGAILNLGIDRSKVGDILIKENCGYVFCSPAIGEYIVDYLIKIKHTAVNCNKVAIKELNIQPTLYPINGTVSSIRLDSIISLAFRTSRSSISGLISAGKVFVNGKLIISNSYQLKEGDVVSVRGMGKFIFRETLHQTKKGRHAVTILKY